MAIIQRWAAAEPFNPGSSKQVLDYLRHCGYRIPKDRKSGKPTTSEDALKDLWLEYPADELLSLIPDARHIKKGIGDLKDNSLGRDSRFHSIFTLVPDTGRLASQRPNLMNVPQGREGGLESEIATAIRETIVADPGTWLVELDWKAIEAVLTGWFANDPGYIKLSLKDSHGFYTSHLMAKAWGFKDLKPFEVDDPDLDSKLEWLKKNYPLERSKGKQANLALGYGMQPPHLASKLKCHPSEAVKFIRIKDEMAPKVTEWKGLTRRQAHAEGKLTNPFGFTRPFYEIFRKNKRTGEWGLATGGEANECLAFLPQSTGAAMLRESLVAIDEVLGNRIDIVQLIPVHDAIVLQATDSMVLEAIGIAQRLMEKEWPELNGLSIKVDIKIGRNWGAMMSLDKWLKTK